MNVLGRRTGGANAEQNIGIGVTGGGSESSTDEIAWDDTNKRFDVLKKKNSSETFSMMVRVRT